ncbi:MAG: hypothetical protein VB064_03635 [Oscillospiraceae bacterium]|nr:hypothetical protein [Oscillospiraceae bacterium]
MEIKPIQNYIMTQASANSTNTKKPAEEAGEAAADTRGTDKIDISSEASFKADLGKYAKIYSAKGTEKASAERITALKQQYQGDTCPISGSDIAAKIISGILGPAVK